MPNGSILFETFRDARLEIHTSEMMSAILSDVIPCIQLTAQSETDKQQPLPANQSINQSTNQSTNQSINQSTGRSSMTGKYTFISVP